MCIKKVSEQYSEYTINMRRTFLQNTELGFQEYKTRRFIKQELTRMGIN